MPPGGDHNNITSINGVDNKWQFVEDGNPSIMDNNLSVGNTLTYEQQMVVSRMIRCYANPDYRRVIADINRYYNEGIIPQGDGFYNLT